MANRPTLHQIEPVSDTGEIRVDRMLVPGGWLYITTAKWAEVESVSTTFVPSFVDTMESKYDE